MSPIPWTAILTHGPHIVAAAQALLSDQKGANQRHQSHEARLDQLEKTSAELTRLIQELAEQVQALGLAQQQAAQEAMRKTRTAFIAASVAIALAVAAIVVAFIR